MYPTWSEKYPPGYFVSYKAKVGYDSGLDPKWHNQVRPAAVAMLPPSA